MGIKYTKFGGNDYLWEERKKKGLEVKQRALLYL